MGAKLGSAGRRRERWRSVCLCRRDALHVPPHPLPRAERLESAGVTSAGGAHEGRADCPIGWYLPRRYEHYYDGRFARDWVAVVTVVGWKLGQPGEVTLSCVAEELALWALMKQAEVQLEIADEDSDPNARSDFREFAFEDEDFLWLYSPELDGIEESDWARERAVANLKFRAIMREPQMFLTDEPLSTSTRGCGLRRGES